ncbi:E3 ubiquitin ligase BIG BROTHER-related [Ricinus communis]|uniref:Ring finger protein, putative n=1 Tax=Ricinus communis TaxID=3988 RepID=B9S2X1_RICCO|nr:E3 ubiquitin ligase BIG BROTHER-related [Ricinus communis]EEF42126.1 ring finger protein, putative [Ricinus communis]|eukprot:XP_002520340.1 E3 ubiquitin ligase BIG BROTHER-related [Ricinus communis]
MENNQERKRSTDEDEERKQAARRVPLAELNQVRSDFAIAMALQNQESAFNVLTSIESESEEDNEESEDFSSEENNGINDYEFFESQDLEFLEGQDSNSDEDMEEEEDDIDPDELSYEELLALGEFIGEEKRGLSIEEISKCLNPSKYKSVENKSEIDRCVICQVEYQGGEPLVSLLPCQHPYHSECIINWLQVKKICPICTTEVSSSPKLVRK